MDIILVAGLWLPATIWADVADQLRALGHRPTPVALPGVDDRSPAATLDDQLAAVVDAVDAAEGPLVVGHSAACTLAWLAADRRARQVGRVALIGGFPSADGATYADLFPAEGGVMAFPGWSVFEGPDIGDLDDDARARVEAVAVPVPVGVSTGLVALRDDARFDVPVVMVCPEYTPDQARAWMDDGLMPELQRARSVAFVDIDSGHWPMVSCPEVLAGVLDRAAHEPAHTD